MPTVRGYCREGQIALKELPEGVLQAEVLVTFLQDGNDIRNLSDNEPSNACLNRT
ncbi:MAG: hypothetical protein P3X24_005065 [bacterium]|nr:hypothetical protein [bacterium]